MSTEFFVRRSNTDPEEWVVWGPMGDSPAGTDEFVGKVAGFSTAPQAQAEARWRNLHRDVALLRRDVDSLGRVLASRTEHLV
jgi:hypothetical protein